MRGDKRAAVGFDFGTSTTLISTTEGVVPIGHDQPWMPSLVGYTDDGEVTVGEAAAYLRQEIRSIKRLITDKREYVQVDLPAGRRDVRADDLMVELLREAVRRAGQSHTAAVVRLGCPAMWDGGQRRRLVSIAQRAGLPVTLAHLVDEPVAAGVAWLVNGRADTSRPLRVLVFDMGGGTFDVAVLDVRGTEHQDMSVLAAFGVAEAGDTLDDALAADLDIVLAAAGIDVDGLAKPRRARERVLDAARHTKVALSTEDEHPVALPAAMFGPNDVWYTRDQLNEVFTDQMDHAELYLATALQIARLAEPTASPVSEVARTPLDTLVNSVDVVVLSGGMSRIPFVAQRLRALFPSTTRIELAAAEPEHAVVLGLAHAARYGRINLYRPAFDIRVEWNWGRESRVIYEAYTPLVEARSVAGAGELRFVRTGADLKLPAEAKGRLRVVSYTGEPVRATLDGDRLDGFRTRINGEEFEFSIYPSGGLRLVDGSGEHCGHVVDWHAGT